MLSVQNISKSYGETNALVSVSFKIERPGIYALMGLNGAGKSTLFQIISGILYPTSGTVSLNDKIADSERKKIIGYLPEENALYHDMTISEYLFFFSELMGLKKNDTRSFIEEMTDRIGIPPSQSIIGELSYGQKRKVLFARAMLNDPPFLILDEPVAQVDVLTERAINSYIKQLAAKGKIILYSTHFFPLAQRLSDSILIIHKGRLLKFETTQSLLEAHPKGIEEAFIQLIDTTQNNEHTTCGQKPRQS